MAESSGCRDRQWAAIDPAVAEKPVSGFPSGRCRSAGDQQALSTCSGWAAAGRTVPRSMVRRRRRSTICFRRWTIKGVSGAVTLFGGSGRGRPQRCADDRNSTSAKAHLARSAGAEKKGGGGEIHRRSKPFARRSHDPRSMPSSMAKDALIAFEINRRTTWRRSACTGRCSNPCSAAVVLASGRCHGL